MEKIYKSPSLRTIKGEKNIILTSKQIEKNPENVRNWFLRNGKHLKTVKDLNFSKSLMESTYSLKNAYLNDLLNIFSKLKNLNLSGTKANILHFGELPKSLKTINLSNNFLFTLKNLPNLNLNFQGASNLTLDFSGNNFAINFNKLPKDFFKNAKNLTIQIFNPPSNFDHEELKLIMEKHFDNKEIKFEIDNKFNKY
jgi:hypothetical protein